MGRLSYEIYLTHMFVVFAAVAVYRDFEADPWFGFLWYAPVVVLCWVLGAALAHGWSIPCDRALRRRWLAARPQMRDHSRAQPVRSNAQ